MKEHESIKKLFQLYISGKHFSQTGRALFGKWLRAPQDQETKEDQLHQYWETVENKISDNTWHDWNRLQAQLTTPTLQKKTFHIQWMRSNSPVDHFNKRNLLGNNPAYFTATC